MCRWLAYTGAPIHLEEALFEADHSLIDQSLDARQSETTTNGDGFGVGWFGERDEPGVYRDVQPAWNDWNLRDLAHQIRSRMFLAHIRAATGTAVQRTNCHPFRSERWLFVHNGVIDGYRELRRDLLFAVDPERFDAVRGTTDSELMFHLALTFGLADDVQAGLERMVGFVESLAEQRGIPHAVQMTVGLGDGERLHAARYSTERRSRTLYYSESVEAIRHLAPAAERFSRDARAIVSEPLSDLAEAWIPVPESTFLTIEGGEVETREFTPRRP